MKRATAFIIGGIALLILLGGGVYWAMNSGHGDSKRANILKLAREYAAQGEDQRALDLLDQLLISNANDADAQALRSEVVKNKQTKEAGDKQAELDLLKSSDDKLKRSFQDLSKELSKTQAGVSSQNQARADAAAAADEDARNKAQMAKDEAARLAKEKQSRDKMSAAEKAKHDLFDQGMGLLTAGDYPGASNKFDQALNADPNYADALIRKAEAVFKEDKNSADGRKQALDLIDQGLSKDPKNSVGYGVQGDIYQATRNWTEAVRSYRNALKTDPENSGYWYELGRVYFLKRQYTDSVDALQHSVKIDSQNSPAYYLMGGAYFNQKDYVDAHDAYASALNLKPANAAYTYWTGKALFNQGKAALALALFEAAAKLDSTKSLYQSDLGVAYYQLGRYTDAELSLQRALAVDNKNGSAAYNLSLTEYQLGKKTMALDYAQKAVALDSSDPDFAYNLGFVLQQTQNPDLAAAAYRTSLKLDPQRVDARVNLATILEDQNDLDGAMSLLKEAYDLAPLNLEVNNNLGKLYMAKQLYSQAIDFFRQALQKKTDTSVIRFNLALAYIETNQKDLAKTVLQDLIKLDPTYWDAYYRLGGVQYDLGDSAGGRQTYQTLLKKNPDYAHNSEIQAILAK